MKNKIKFFFIIPACLLAFSLAPTPAYAGGGGIPIISDIVNVVVNVIDTFVIDPVTKVLDFFDLDGLSDMLDCGVDSLKGNSCSSLHDVPEEVVASVPSKPQNVEITNCDGTDRNPDGSCVLYINHGYRITWDIPADLGGASSVGYKIHRGQSESPLNTLITTPEMDAGQKYFEENRIQDPSQPFYYKVVAFNTVGESDGDVVKAPTDIRYLTDVLTLTGSGFSDDTKVYLINNGNSILCAGFIATDSHTLTGGVCDITFAPTGDWTVRIQNQDGKRSDCVDCFKIALPDPVSPTVDISKIDLSDGIFKIDSVAGDNLYTGASVRVALDSKKLDCFSLSSFDYKNNEFPGGQCNVGAFQEFLKTLGFTSDSDISKLSVEILNDPNSAPVIPSGIPTFICESTTYTPDASTVCGSSLITQYSNCGVAISAMPSLICSSGQVCQDGVCVGCTPSTAACGTWVCGNVSDGCGGIISCGPCSGTCVNGTCVLVE